MPHSHRRRQPPRQATPRVLNASILPFEERSGERGISCVVGAANYELDGDRVWFDAHPQRDYRIRPMHPNERIVAEAGRGHAIVLPRGFILYTVIERMPEGTLHRSWFVGHESINSDDIAEESCAFAFSVCFNEAIERRKPRDD